MGASVFSRLLTQRDVAGMFTQLKVSPLDPVRRRQTFQNSLTRERTSAWAHAKNASPYDLHNFSTRSLSVCSAIEYMLNCQS